MLYFLRATIASALLLAASALHAQGQPILLYNFSEQEAAWIDPISLDADKARQLLPPLEGVEALYDHYLSENNVPIVALLRCYNDVTEALNEQGQ